MIHLYTGEGKGKTTAAVGLAVRAAGCGKKVLFCQFMKGNETGEIRILETLSQVTILRCSRKYPFYKAMSEEDQKQITREHNEILREIIRQTQSCQWDMAVLDEITYPVSYGLVDEKLLQKLLALGESRELVLTGRNPVPYLMKAADYLTEMRCVRHPYERGIRAREGVEY